MILPREVQSGNALAYRHWRERMRDRDAWIALLRSALVSRPLPPPTGKRYVHILAYRKRRVDEDNLSSGCKHLRDAMVRVGILKDDTREWCHFTYAQGLASGHPSGRPCTEVTVSDEPIDPPTTSHRRKVAALEPKGKA